jgi:multidrug efflux pump
MGAIMTIVSGPPSANIDYTEKYTSQLPKIFSSVPEKEGYGIINGYNGANSAIAFLVLKPWSERHRTVPQIIPSLFPSLFAITGIQAFPVNPFRLPGSNDLTPINFVLKTTGSYRQLADTLGKFQSAVNKNPGFVNVTTTLKFDQPQLDMEIDRNKAADLGISATDVGNALNLALGEPVVGHFEMSGRSYDIIPQLAAPYMKNPDGIYNLNLRTAEGQLVPLSNLIKIKQVSAPQSLTHFQQQRSGALTASLAPGYSLGQAINFLETNAKKIMPADTQYDFAGTSRQFIQAGSSMQTTFIFALIFIFLILAAQFESFLDPLIVMFSVIPAIAGALIALRLTGGTINIYTQIGFVTLIGLISKHGILMVEFANQLREKGRSLHEAIIEAATIRFRPILMTTASMVLGAIPLTLASGAGAVSRQQMGWVIAGGMLFGTCVTLFVVPCAYLTIKRVAKYFARRPVVEANKVIDGSSNPIAE